MVILDSLHPPIVIMINNIFITLYIKSQIAEFYFSGNSDVKNKLQLFFHASILYKLK